MTSLVSLLVLERPAPRRLPSAAQALLAVIWALGCTCAVAAGGDAAAGKRKTVTCNGCHGQAGMRSVPSLGGQNPVYFVASMRAYQDGVRTHATMRDVAKAFSDRDLKNFAAYYADPVVPAAEPAPAAPEAATQCAACHGVDGRDPVTPDVPRIAGQKAPYVEQVLGEYRAGTRKHAVMQEQAAALTDADIVVLAAYYAGRAALVVK
jgi:cytochrome c553